MKNLKSYMGCVIAAGIAIGGCGGAGISDNGTRGEGNIPIGELTALPGSVSVTTTSVAPSPITGSVDGQGVVWMPRLPLGNNVITLTPLNTSYDPLTITVNFGSQQQYVIAAALNAHRNNAAVSGLVIDTGVGSVLSVGGTYTLNVMATGTNIAGLTPTLWIDGGVGYFDVNRRFVAVTAGNGVLRAQLLGVTASMPIAVR